MDTAQRYMPQASNTFKGAWENLYRRLAYDIWRRELKRFSTRRAQDSLKIADVGCGPGFLLSCISKWYPQAELTGVDQSDALLEVARSRCKGLVTLKGDAASALPLEDQSVDAMFALHVVEHLVDPMKFLREAHRALLPGGMLVVATPNLEGWGAKIMKEKWMGYKDPTHIQLHGPQFWREALGQAGFDIARDGTTGLSGISWLSKMPLILVHWIPTFFAGYYSWERGEAYIAIGIRKGK
jgi:ubiquinone/menaquinone biosynthesis C-methylase UbiE